MESPGSRGLGAAAGDRSAGENVHWRCFALAGENDSHWKGRQRGQRDDQACLPGEEEGRGCSSGLVLDLPSPEAVGPYSRGMAQKLPQIIFNAIV